MKAKKITEIAEFMEKLGYEVIGIKEREEDAVYRKTIEIRITPINDKNTDKN